MYSYPDLKIKGTSIAQHTVHEILILFYERFMWRKMISSVSIFITFVLGCRIFKYLGAELYLNVVYHIDPYTIYFH